MIIQQEIEHHASTQLESMRENQAIGRKDMRKNKATAFYRGTTLLRRVMSIVQPRSLYANANVGSYWRASKQQSFFEADSPFGRNASSFKSRQNPMAQKPTARKCGTSREARVWAASIYVILISHSRAMFAHRPAG